MTSIIARAVLSITLLCCAFLGIMLLIGALIPMPFRASLLTSNPCALPCIYNVTLGVTTRNDARSAFEHALIPSSLLNPGLPSFAVPRSNGTRPLLALLDFGSPDGAIVRSVLLYQMEGGRELGALSDFLLAGYQPNRVLSACANTQSIVIT